MKKLKILGLILIFIFLSGFGLKCEDTKTKQAMQPVNLKFWRVWDETDDFKEIVDAYQRLHPYVKIEYRKFRYGEYEKALLEAMAEDQGPDIFSVHNTWVRGYQKKIKPMPEKITMVYPVLQGTIKKEIINQLKTEPSITVKKLRETYIDVVPGDVILNVTDDATKTTSEKIFGLPLSVDTLAMFYNKDLFNNAGIIDPPKYWNEEFQKIVKNLTKIDEKGQLVQSGVALGGSANIERYSDILSVLMMQNGTDMQSDSGEIRFHTVPAVFKNKGITPGIEALQFYSDFANPTKEVYSWNATLSNSLEMFARGKLAVMFGYSYHIPMIKAMSPKLNFAVAALPQIEGNPTVNFANYWVETVSNKSKQPDEAWDLIQFAAKAENVKSYLKKTKKTTALRSLINEELEDADKDIFAGQLLTAKSWYKGRDSNAMEQAFKEMIDAVNTGEEKIITVINQGANKVQQTVK